jgi:hypothetical protein
MSQRTRPPASALPVLPDERFWQRYSPHHEFTLSGATSVALHAGVILLLVLGTVAATRAGLGGKGQVPSVTIVQMEDEGPSSAVAPGRRDQPMLLPPDPQPSLGDARQQPLPLVLPTPLQVPEPGEDGRLLQLDNDAAKTTAMLGEIGARLKPRPPAGPGGTEGNRLERVPRMLRWTMLFNTQNGDDYARQLHGLGAILAIPAEGQEGRYLILRDLGRRPVQGEVGNVADIQRIFWVDDKPDSVRALALALGLKNVPSHVVAFFPAKLEGELLDKELRYAGRKEEQIEATRFRVVRTRDGYGVDVVAQTPAR